MKSNWIHLDKTPRLGGICILTLFSYFYSGTGPFRKSCNFVFCGSYPIFAIGFIEDILRSFCPQEVIFLIICYNRRLRY